MKVKCIDVEDLGDPTMVLGEIYEVQHITDTHYRINGNPYYRSRFEIVKELPKNMQITINDTIIDAMQLSIVRMQSYANVIKANEEFSRPDSVGDSLRLTHSCILTEMAVIKEFVSRCKESRL